MRANHFITLYSIELSAHFNTLNRTPYPRALPLVAVCILAISSCSPSLRGNIHPSQLDIDVRTHHTSAFDKEVARKSEALHSYLAGQLAYDKQDFEGAVGNFSKASGLLDTPVPLLSGRLAELYVRSGDLTKALEETEKALKVEPDNLQLLMLQAGIFQALERDAEAETIYLRMIAADRDRVDPAILLSGMYARQQKFDQAVSTLKALGERKPNEPIVVYYLGREYEQAGDLNRSEQYYTKALGLDPKNEQFQKDLIRLAIKQEDTEKLRAVCQRLVDQDPSNSLARKILGQILLGESKLDEALSHLKVVEETEYDATNTRYQIALIQIEKQNYAEAIRELSLVLAKNPSHEEARYNLASIFASTGRPMEATEELLKIEPEQSLFAKSRTFAAFLFRQEGKLEDAEDAIREALEVEENDKQSLSYLVLILSDAKKFDEAEEIMQELVEQNPEDEKILFNYAILLHDQDKREESLRVMEKVLDLNPENSDALNYIAYGLAEEGVELERALELIERALRIRPSDGFYLDTLGWIFFKLDRMNEAEAALSRATSIVTDDPEILEHYADVLVKVDKQDRAREFYIKALERTQTAKSAKNRSVAIERIESKLQALVK
ncbi:MAG: hypothetical protein DCC75_06505 [Proteobacteria bacterium]|nr:MAG: hypothetical protein DCC75_06505 [Pseudomonadota bacterium]